ncbi:MAG TPA: diacylglycerol kinase family protein [Symbiobacteriaceae bacterium]
MRPLCFIVNPTAGHGRALKLWKRLEPLAASLGDFEVKLTRYPGHARELAREAARGGFDRVIAVGGDGTVSEVAAGLVGTAAAFGVIPSGTGNDWIKSTGVPRDPEAALRVAFSGRRAKMDVGLAFGRHLFFNVAGIGFDAEVMRRVNGYGPVLKMFGGAVPHLLGVLGALREYRGVDVEVELDGRSFAVSRMALMAVGIGRFFGGGLMILPNAAPDDGLFDIVWGDNLNRLELLNLLIKLFPGTHMGHPKVHFARGRRLVIRSDRPVFVEADGEVIGQLPVSLELLPGALEVLLPS